MSSKNIRDENQTRHSDYDVVASRAGEDLVVGWLDDSGENCSGRALPQEYILARVSIIPNVLFYSTNGISKLCLRGRFGFISSARSMELTNAAVLGVVSSQVAPFSFQLKVTASL
jgi:hypothetical protein